MKVLIALFSLSIMTNAFATKVVARRLNPLEKAYYNKEFSEKLADLQARGGSGDIVGNGGGLVEQNFQYAYDKAADLIDHCSVYKNCDIDAEDLAILEEIKLTIISNWGNKERLKFIPSQFEDFFNDEGDYETRIAKTGFDPSFPILINLNLAYRNESFTYDFGAMIAIVIHEVGHQIGIIDHGYLDFLGQALRRETIAQQDNFGIKIVNGKFNIAVLNSGANKLSKPGLYVSFNNKSIPLLKKVTEEIHCPINSELLGFNVENGHFSKPNIILHRVLLQFQSWLTFFCENKESKTIRVFQRDMNMEFYLYRTESDEDFVLNDMIRVKIY